MPANIIAINGVSEFYVGDSKMPQFLRWLKENGFPYNKEATEILKYAGRLPPDLVHCLTH